MELIVIRHGTTAGNLERRFVGTLDLPLIPQGEALARRVGPTLPAVEHVYRSPMLRCAQTAALLWPGVAETVIPDLRETDFGPFEGKNHEELKDDPVYQAWIGQKGGPNFAAPPVGEPPEEAEARAVRGLAAVLEDAGRRGLRRAGLVSHGGTIMGILAQYGRPERGYYSWMCPNCGGFRLAVEDGLLLRLIEPVGGEPPA